jgi:hypothetical protein
LDLGLKIGTLAGARVSAFEPWGAQAHIKPFRDMLCVDQTLQLPKV